MISARQVLDALVAAGVPANAIGLFDAWYECPTANWVTRKLGESMSDFLYRAGINYSDEQFDCNHYAKLGSAIADLCWVRTRDAGAALAFGMFAFVGDQGGHMICVAVHAPASATGADAAPGAELRVAWYEPQPTIPAGHQVVFTGAMVSMQEVKLTRKEITSCVSCLFL